MDSNGVRLILIVLGVALLVAIYLWDRFTRRSKGKAPRKLKRKPRERREPGVVGPAPDIDDADEWRAAAEPVEEEPPVAQPEPAKERGLYGRRKRAEKEPTLSPVAPASGDDRQPTLPFDEPAPAPTPTPVAEEPPKILVINVVAKAAYFGGPDLMQAAEEGVFLGLVRERTGHIGWCIGLHAGWVWVIQVARQLTDGNAESPYAFLTGDYDGVIGWLAAGWLAVLSMAYRGLAGRSGSVTATAGRA